MIKEAIILAGGLGTRLRTRVPELPKCMAPVAGHPFLLHLVRHLLSQGVERFIFSLGYRHEYIEAFLAEECSWLNYTCVVESEPLGTGGAIFLALQEAKESHVVVANGDTLYRVNLEQLEQTHRVSGAVCSLALKPMRHFDRYGVVTTDANGRISHFAEKKWYDSGLINGGVYLLNREALLQMEFPQKFSFEKDFLEKGYTEQLIMGREQDAYFIDIGIPADYDRAAVELQHKPPDLAQINRSWTLFLDRDGVINHDKIGSYVFNAGEFAFFDAVPEAMKIFSEHFGRIVVVTNQRGVGRGLMSTADLEGIHAKMMDGVQQAGGRIDAIFFCTATDNKDPHRKPNPGMALDARRKFPEIDFSRSIMAGNNPGDLQFGRNAGMHTVFITTTRPPRELPDPDIDLQYSLLTDLAREILAAKRGC